jgi:ankyrin repeat protein
MQHLPNELLPAIAAQLESERDINTLAQTNRRFFSCLDQFLYRRNIQYSDSSALEWSAICGQEQTAKKALDYGPSCIGEALVLAADNGHEGVTRLLLSFYTPGANSGGKQGQEALSRAVTGGFASIVGLLLDSG